MKNNTLTGEDFVRATIAFLREKGTDHVSFDPNTYDAELTKNELPWCVTFDQIIDTVCIADDGSERIVLCVENGGAIFYEYFDGSENEDFDHIFHDVYDELWDGGMTDEEADCWLDAFIGETDIRKRLVRLLDRLVTGGIQYITEPYLDPDSGLQYDCLRRVRELGNKLYLTDSINGENNPTALMLTSLPEETLIRIIRRIADYTGEYLRNSFNGLFKSPKTTEDDGERPDEFAANEDERRDWARSAKDYAYIMTEVNNLETLLRLVPFICKKLDGYTEQNPKTVDFTLEPDDAVGLSTLEMPKVTAVWPDESGERFHWKEYGYDGTMHSDILSAREAEQFYNAIQ